MPRWTTPLRALERVDAAGALPTLVRGALSAGALQQLLSESLPEEARLEMPQEIWSGLAAGIAAESEPFARALAERVHESLAWDTDPGSMDEWWRLVRERPIEALWLSALSDRKEIRDEFEHMARHCVENYRASSEDSPPSWEFVEGVLGVQARTLAQLRESERRAVEAERRAEAARRRIDDLRDQLKRLRRENASLRASRAEEKHRGREVGRAPEPEGREERKRLLRLERQLRKLDKEREHMRRLLERAEEPPDEPAPSGSLPEPAAEPPPEPELPAIDEDPEPSRRILRFVLSKLVAKGKIGGSHTHQDNVLRSLPDHEKGLAREVVDHLYRASYLIPKPTLNDPHLSLAPERLREAHDIIEGRAGARRLAASVLGRVRRQPAAASRGGRG